jgi:hypothetical protein
VTALFATTGPEIQLALSHAGPRRLGKAIEHLDATQRVSRIVAAVVRQIGVALGDEYRTRGAKRSGNRGAPCENEDRLFDWPGTNPHEIENRLCHGFAAHLIVARFQLQQAVNCCACACRSQCHCAPVAKATADAHAPGPDPTARCSRRCPSVRCRRCERREARRPRIKTSSRF